MRRGLTMVELIIGTVILGMIGLAVASFTVATSTGWRNSEETYRVANLGTRSSQQVQDRLSKALAIVRPAPATQPTSSSYVFFWSNDAYGTASDGKAQFGEMALLEYDAAAQAVYLYEPKSPSGLSASDQALLASDNWGDPAQMPTIVSYFKSSSVVKPARAIVGGVTGSPGVSSAAFAAFKPTGGKPLAMYDIVIGSGDAAAHSYGSIALRAAKTPQNVN
jgi:type II secretory pathway pseudopilin PulG